MASCNECGSADSNMVCLLCVCCADMFGLYRLQGVFRLLCTFSTLPMVGVRNQQLHTRMIRCSGSTFPGITLPCHSHAAEKHLPNWNVVRGQMRDPFAEAQ